MSTVEIILVALVVVFGLLALGGFLAGRRRAAANAEHFQAELLRSNRDLAAAHAEDNGWNPERLAEAARAAFSEQGGGAAVTSLELVQVVDPPGKDQDKAVFSVGTERGTQTLTLGRRGDDWHLESLT